MAGVWKETVTLLSACSLPKLGITPSPKGASREDKCVMSASRALTTQGLSARVSPQLSQVTLGNWKGRIHKHTHPLPHPHPLHFHRSPTMLLYLWSLLSAECKVAVHKTCEAKVNHTRPPQIHRRPLASTLVIGKLCSWVRGLMLIWCVV